MTTKQYLRQAYRLNELIQSDLEELDQLKALSTSISSPNLSGMPHSASRPTEAPFTKCIMKIVDLEKIINDEIDRFVDLKKEVRETINTVQAPNERLVLKLRYIEFLKWEAVAAKMNLSLKQVHRIHGDALQNIKIPYSDTD
jgi:DNA-directed RNA polymerase specialized sigma subunit